jgi:outer membrane protein TolC
MQQPRRSLALLSIFCLVISWTALSNAENLQPGLTAKQKLPLSLAQAVELALKNNRDLKTARRNLSIAASNYRAAKAQYYPQITGSFSVEHALFNNLEIEPRIANRFSTSLFNVNLTMPLDLSGAIGRGVQTALINVVATKAQYLLAAQTLVVNVYAQYYAVLSAVESIRIDRAQVDQAEEQSRIAEARLKKGRIPEADVLTARVQLDNARQTLKIDEGGFDIAVATLLNTLVLSQEVEIIPTDKLTFSPENFTYEKAFKEGEKNRLEMQINRLNLEAANIALKSSYDQYRPSVNITGSYGYNLSGRSPATAIEERQKGPLWQLVAGLTVPIFIFDGGTIKESKIRAMTGIEQAQANIQQTRETIALEVKSQVITLQNTQDRVEILKNTAKQGSESLRIADLRYRMGLSSYLEYADARNNLRTAELNLLTAIREHSMAKVNMAKAIGRPLVLDTMTLQTSDQEEADQYGKKDKTPKEPQEQKLPEPKAPPIQPPTTSLKTREALQKELPAGPKVEATSTPTLRTVAQTKESSMPPFTMSPASPQRPLVGDSPSVPPTYVPGVNSPKAAAASNQPRSATANLKKTSVRIFNASGDQGLGRRIVDLLNKEGVQEVKMGNCRDFGVGKTLIYFRSGAEQAAQVLNTKYFQSSKVRQNDKLSGDADIEIFLGKDLLANKELLATKRN